MCLHYGELICLKQIQMHCKVHIIVSCSKTCNILGMHDRGIRILTCLYQSVLRPLLHLPDNTLHKQYDNIGNLAVSSGQHTYPKQTYWNSRPLVYPFWFSGMYTIWRHRSCWKHEHNCHFVQYGWEQHNIFSQILEIRVTTIWHEVWSQQQQGKGNWE